MKHKFALKLIALLLMVFMCFSLTGCDDDLYFFMITVFITGGGSSVALTSDNSVANYADSKILAFDIKSNDVELNLKKTSTGTVTVAEGLTGTKISADADSVITRLDLHSPTEVTMAKSSNNAREQSISVITVNPGASGSTLSAMPYKLVLKPGTWVMIGGERYENTSKEHDLTLPAPESTKSNASSGSSNGCSCVSCPNAGCSSLASCPCPPPPPPPGP